MKQEFVKIALSDDHKEHTVYFGLCVSPPRSLDAMRAFPSHRDGLQNRPYPEVPHEFFLPIGREVGDVEALRKYIIERINDTFDAVQNKGKFAK